MRTISNKVARVVPFALLKAFSFRIFLTPLRIAVPASGIGAWALSDWEPGWMARILAALVPEVPGTFVDIGANIGQTMLAYKMANGKQYLGIEPNPNCAGFVDTVISANAINGYRIVPIGLSDYNGFTKLYCSDPTDTGATMMTNLRSIEGRHEQVVPIASLDFLLSCLQIEDAGIIKIDVEAYELEVLRGMRGILSKYSPIVICEVLGTGAGRPLEIKRKRNAEIMQILRELDYEARRINKSPDGALSTEHVDVFPDVHWTVETRENFDYFFVPRGKSGLMDLIA